MRRLNKRRGVRGEPLRLGQLEWDVPPPYVRQVMNGIYENFKKMSDLESNVQYVHGLQQQLGGWREPTPTGGVYSPVGITSSFTATSGVFVTRPPSEETDTGTERARLPPRLRPRPLS